MTREELHATFYRLFADPKEGQEGQSVEIDQLTKVEEELSITFPKAYMAFITRYGGFYTPSILTLVTGGESEIAPEGASWDVQEFLQLQKIIEVSKLYWSGGMQSDLVVIASDCMGNVFGFRRQQPSSREDDSPVLFFDHDFCKIHEESSSFDAWLESFVKLADG